MASGSLWLVPGSEHHRQAPRLWARLACQTCYSNNERRQDKPRVPFLGVEDGAGGRSWNVSRADSGVLESGNDAHCPAASRCPETRGCTELSEQMHLSDVQVIVFREHVVNRHLAWDWAPGRIPRRLWEITSVWPGQPAPRPSPTPCPAPKPVPLRLSFPGLPRLGCRGTGGTPASIPANLLVPKLLSPPR